VNILQKSKVKRVRCYANAATAVKSNNTGGGAARRRACPREIVRPATAFGKVHDWSISILTSPGPRWRTNQKKKKKEGVKDGKADKREDPYKVLGASDTSSAHGRTICRS